MNYNKDNIESRVFKYNGKDYRLRVLTLRDMKHFTSLLKKVHGGVELDTEEGIDFSINFQDFLDSICLESVDKPPFSNMRIGDWAKIFPPLFNFVQIELMGTEIVEESEEEIKKKLMMIQNQPTQKT